MVASGGSFHYVARLRGGGGLDYLLSFFPVGIESTRTRLSWEYA